MGAKLNKWYGEMESVAQDKMLEHTMGLLCENGQFRAEVPEKLRLTQEVAATAFGYVIGLAHLWFSPATPRCLTYAQPPALLVADTTRLAVRVGLKNLMG